MAHQKIADPFLKDNHSRQRWISESNIRYSTTFNLDANILKYKNHKLVFEGIDTYGTVILNGEKILTTENAFIKYSAGVNHLLKTGENKLEVEIKSPK